MLSSTLHFLIFFFIKYWWKNWLSKSRGKKFTWIWLLGSVKQGNEVEVRLVGPGLQFCSKSLFNGSKKWPWSEAFNYIVLIFFVSNIDEEIDRRKVGAKSSLELALVVWSKGMKLTCCKARCWSQFLLFLLHKWKTLA